METKHTKEYAEKLAIQHVKNYGGYKSDYIAGYMKAIKETAAPDLLEALIELVEWEKVNYVEPELFKKIQNAINKATK